MDENTQHAVKWACQEVRFFKHRLDFLRANNPAITAKEEALANEAEWQLDKLDLLLIRYKNTDLSFLSQDEYKMYEWLRNRSHC